MKSASERESVPPKGLFRKRFLHVALGLLLAYLIAAYVIIPFAWEAYAKHHPQFDDDPRVTQTGDKHPGDPLNVALVGTEDEVKRVMELAGWKAAAALGLKSDLKIAEDTILSRPDNEAPVSNLFLYGRKEDLAFEQPVGDNPRQRHHVRFWRTGKNYEDDGRPIWIGSASYDERVGLSHTTGQVTHHISGDVDAERDHLMKDLKNTRQLSEDYAVADFHTTREGRNGGGDPWHTDGQLLVGIVALTSDAK
jgi:hypothetical protein